jgi:predicted DNA-binding protein (MmcQ/YjbR family)
MSDPESFRNYCLSKPGVTEEFPFGDENPVYKVMGKIFAIASLDTEVFRYNLKADPEHIHDLRLQYPAVQPGYHMNKAHWNTVYTDGSIPVKELKAMVDESYRLIVESLPARLKNQLPGAG